MTVVAQRDKRRPVDPMRQPPRVILLDAGTALANLDVSRAIISVKPAELKVLNDMQPRQAMHQRRRGTHVEGVLFSVCAGLVGDSVSEVDFEGE